MDRYAPPRIEATHAVEDLLADAAGTQYAPSDVALKDDVQPIPGSLGGLRDVPLVTPAYSPPR